MPASAVPEGVESVDWSLIEEVSIEDIPVDFVDTILRARRVAVEAPKIGPKD